jgi:suppressor for copper-sensitivity B
MIYRRTGWLGAAVTVVALTAGLPARAEPAASPWFETEQGEVRLLAAQPAIGADNEIELGLEFRLQPHWKIYWRSPGDAGYPPRLDWTGSRNLKSAQIEWPAPQRFSVLGLETVGYSGTVVLPIIARLDEAGAPLALRLGLDYLTCSEICIPYQTTLTLDLPAGPPSAGATGFGALIARYAAQVPTDGGAGVTITGATWRPGRAGRLELAVKSDPPLVAPDAFIEGAGGVVFGAPRTVAGLGPGEAVLRLPASGTRAALAALPGRKLTVTLVDDGRAMEAVVTPVPGSPAVDLAALWPMLAVALLGGLILNIMPCVLPVLGLKLLGAISHAGRSQAAVRRGFLATAGGILLSFLALALAAIGLRAAGVAVGWGIQFQDPLFLAAMAALLTLFAANLWGLFEVPLPSALTGLAGRAHSEGLLGSVATGAFATLLATPCSAPFLGTAIGFALAAGPVEILAIFLALGLGFAAPYVLVAAVPRLALALPRPGRWMVAMRRILGVALGVSALWLLWVLAAESGAAAGLAIAALLAAAVAALAALHTPMARRGTVAAALVAALLVPVAAPRVMPRPSHDAFWRPFDQAAIGELVRDGHVVFVDVSAAWCLTCKVNERLVLDSAPVRDRLAAPAIVPMRADWTRPDATIADYLRGFGRYGIPFNAVYGPGAPSGLVLPEILTAERVVAALRQAESRAVASGR